MRDKKQLKRVKQARKHGGLHGPLWAAVSVALYKVQKLPFDIWPGLVKHGTSRPNPVFRD